MNTTHQYLSGTLVSDPVGSVSSRGTPCVRFTLQKDAGDEEPAALSFWCFVADLWPTILACRKGDALSVVGRLRRQHRISRNETDRHCADFMVRQILSVRKLTIRTASGASGLPEAA